MLHSADFSIPLCLASKVCSRRYRHRLSLHGLRHELEGCYAYKRQRTWI